MPALVFTDTAKNGHLPFIRDRLPSAFWRDDYARLLVDRLYRI